MKLAAGLGIEPGSLKSRARLSGPLLDRAKQLQILVASARRSLDEIRTALEAFETGGDTKGTYATLQRGFHAIKHDARHVGLGRFASLAEDCESIVERAADRGRGLPLEILARAAQEIQAAVEAVAKGGRHRLDAKLVRQVHRAAEVRVVG